MYAFRIFQRPVKKECARLRDTIYECKQQDPHSVYTLRRDADLQLRTGKFRTLSHLVDLPSFSQGDCLTETCG